MLTAPAFDLPATPRRKPVVPVALSALAHLVVALAWVGFPVPEPKREEDPPAITVDIVPPAAKPAPKAEVKERPGPAGEQPAQIPQLQPGALADKSTPEAKPSGGGANAVAADKPKKKAPVTQNERDFVLSQVIRHWKPPQELAARPEAELSVGVEVGPGGFLLGAYDARRPWNPAEVFDGYGQLPPQDLQRRTIDSFYAAIRKAQPLKLPPQLAEKAPFKVRLHFRARDVR